MKVAMSARVREILADETKTRSLVAAIKADRWRRRGRVDKAEEALKETSDGPRFTVHQISSFAGSELEAKSPGKA
jgi:hypothetical protein